METLVNNCKLSAKNAEEERVMDSTSDNIKFAPHNDPNDVIDELFQPLRSSYPRNLETWMTGSDFIFDSVQLMYEKSHKVSFICAGSYLHEKEKDNNKS